MAETLISLLIVSMAVMAAFNFVSTYKKITFERDVSMSALIKNITAVESLRAEDDIFPRLHELSLTHDIKVTAVGTGELQINSDGTYNIIGEDIYNLPDELKPEDVKLLKVEIGESTPNSKIITVVRIK